MKAVVVDHDAPERLVIKEIEDPIQKSDDLLVRVEAFSLNGGETRFAMGNAENGFRPGWDLVGIVEKSAPDGSGPRVGERVNGIRHNETWAEKVIVSVGASAVVPAGVPISVAASIPMGGLTAYHVLKRGGLLLGKKVLVTGATGVVGDFLLRLAKLSGAITTAYIRDVKNESLVREAGADQVAIGTDLYEAAKAFGPFDLIAESVGGPTMKGALRMLNWDGQVIMFGLTSSEPLEFAGGDRFLGAGTLAGLSIYHELANRESAEKGLHRLNALAAEGKLQPQIGLESSWKEIATVATSYLARKYPGKVVLYVE
jgi:NADPH:quinone reductase-like Zn-dependent oxidoreductase